MAIRDILNKVGQGLIIKLQRINFIILLLASTFLLFMGHALLVVFSKGVCCADDAYHAVVAKNLANGLGYTSTILAGSWEWNPLKFDPFIGTGPVSILPASLMIFIFGNTYWAPGVSHILLWGSVLLLVGIKLLRHHDRTSVALIILSFSYLSYMLFTFHYAQWVALLGEIPAALFIILAYLVFVNNLQDSGSIKNLPIGIFFLIGFLLGLAVQTKLLSLIAVASFCIVYWGFVIIDTSINPLLRIFFLIRSTFYFCGGLIIPTLCFEIWKFYELDTVEYFNRFNNYKSFVFSQGLEGIGGKKILAIYTRRSEIIFEQFGVTLIEILLLISIAFYLVWNDFRIRCLLFFLLIGIILYTYWWLFLSNGWPRYYIICLIMIMAVIILPLMVVRKAKIRTFYFCLILLWPSTNWNRIELHFHLFLSLFKIPGDDVVQLLQAAGYLSKNNLNRKIVTHSFPTASDLEYILEGHSNFISYRDPTCSDHGSFLIAENKSFWWVWEKDLDYLKLREKCDFLWETRRYVIKNCPVTACPKNK